MGRTWLMGLDLGGGSVRCLLLDAETGARYSAARPWSFPGADGTGGLGYELPLERMWSAIAEVSREALARGEVKAREVAGVSVASMRFGSVILDPQGEARFAVPNRDARAAVDSFRLAAERGEDLLRATGLWPLPVHASARLLWLQRERPEVLERGCSLLSMGDWLIFRLCGARVTDFSQAGCTGLFDLQRRAWSFELIGALDLPREIFPQVRASGERVGELGAESAAELGLAPGTPVVLGAADTRCGLLGAGAVANGDTALIAGTTAPLEVVSDRPLIDPEGRLRSGHHAVPGLFVLESSGGPLGETLAWVARLLYPGAPRPEALFLAAASTAAAGSAGMLSTLGAEVANDRAPSLPVGQLTLSHVTGAAGEGARANLARSVLEGYACAARANLEQLARVAGEGPRRLRLSGGLSRSELFARILADVTGTEVQCAETPEASALGAVLCAGVGAGLFADLAEAVRAHVRASHVYAPRSETAEASARLYQDWSELREAGATTTLPATGRLVLPWALRASAGLVESRALAHRPRVLVTAAFDDASLERMRRFADVDHASFRDTMQILTGPSLVEALGDRDVLVTEMDVVEVAVLKRAPQLRVVAACRGDAVNVDVDACTAFGIPVLFAPGRNAEAVADLTLAFLLNLARRLPAASAFLSDPSVAAGDLGKMGQAFQRFQGYELWGKTVGLVGLGAVGRAAAKRLAGFGARLLVADPYVSAEQATLAGCEKVDLDTLLRESDFVSLHAAVMEQTRGLLGAAELATMKPGSFLINTARAALVDEVALLDALDRGHLAGAALDTFAVEPPGADHPLVRHGSVIHTPHIGGNTNEVATHQGEIVSEALERLARGERPRCVLNPEALESFSWTGPRRSPDDSELARLAGRPGPALSDLQRDGRAEACAEELSGAAAPPAMVATMTRILERFTSAMAADARVRAFSAEKDAALYFVLPDLGLDLYVALRDGTVAAGLGRPEGGSVVQLRMRAEILDGMLRGTVNPMERAMQGDIAFTGDAAKAMAIQQLQADMQRLYTAARAEIGDPGDLASIARPGAGTAARPVGAGDVRAELVAVVNELYEARVITATGGNVSVRVPGAENEVWITPSQLFKGDLRPEVLVRIDLDGQSQDPEARSPSSEWSMHTQILKKKAEAKAVIHAHAPHATTLANAGLPFLPISTEAAFFGNIPRVPFIMPGSAELAEAVSEAMKDEWAVLMVNHGLVVCGRSLRRAADLVEIVERSAELILSCYAVGKEPPVLPESAVATLRAMGDLVA